MTLHIRPLSPDRMPDLDRLFAARGCAEARHCYCMFYRHAGGRAPEPASGGGAGSSRAAPRPDARAELQALAGADPSPGLIAYRDGAAVGWVSLGPRADFVRLLRSRAMRAPDATPVWSIVCFVVPSAFRGQGIAHGLLAGAIDFARSHGAAWLEAYPVDRERAPKADLAWFGSASMYCSAGFVEVARHQPARPLMRRALGPDPLAGKDPTGAPDGG